MTKATSKRAASKIGRPAGAKNRSGEELIAAGKALIKEGKLKARIESLKEQLKK